MHGNFRYHNFLKHRRVPLRIFLARATKCFQRKIVIPHLLSIKFFPYPKFLKHRRDSLRSFLVLWDKKIRQNHNAPPMHQNFWYQNFFEAQKGSPAQFFGTVRQNFSRENRDITFLWKKFFRYPKASDTTNSSPTKFFGTVRQKMSNKKSWYRPLLHQIQKSVVENLRKQDFKQKSRF